MIKISDIAFSRSGKINCVYIFEKDGYIPYLVLTGDYNGNTLLLRKDAENEPRSFNDYSSYYADSGIDSYLNGDYIRKLSEISPYIVDSTIEITTESSLGNSQTETEAIVRKVFLLSCNEVGIKDSVNIAREGKPLAYFKEQENRMAYVSGKASSWWLRTPDPYYLSCPYVIGDNNKLGFTNAYDKNGVRPAFCVRNDMKVVLKSNIVTGEKVYVFAFKD